MTVLYILIALCPLEGHACTKDLRVNSETQTMLSKLS